ncbi:glycosyltransferase [Sodalis sp.]|uniref:glycosyltransferase n=1 Tax=Sodalis sp. (in: enterobacteria) TaxID=1898979 RepID=UPI0038738FB7
MECLSAFDTLIFASRSEGLLRVMLETMLLGTPVIGSAVTGIAKLCVIRTPACFSSYLPMATWCNWRAIWSPFIAMPTSIVCWPGAPMDAFAGSLPLKLCRRRVLADGYLS